MSKKNCDMIRDLLPLYAENLCSEESRNAVAEHLSNCSECKKLLGKMSTSVNVSVDRDITAIKKIKRKIIIKRIAAVVISVIVAYATCIAMIAFMMSPVRIQYGDGMEDNVTIQTDSDGNVWVGRKMDAASGYIFPTISDADGNHFYYDDDFDSNNKVGYGFSIIKERYKNISMFNINSSDWQYSKLFNLNDKPEISYIFYYDTEADKEIVLWEKDK